MSNILTTEQAKSIKDMILAANNLGSRFAAGVTQNDSLGNQLVIEMHYKSGNKIFISEFHTYHQEWRYEKFNNNNEFFTHYGIL